MQEKSKRGETDFSDGGWQYRTGEHGERRGEGEVKRYMRDVR